ncbi:MAG: hypothetical protein GF311_11625 [Candidatus Lokiarchaeota archaeon]|nr:hypothetical protein [Candidatus Lokiarchaeota archaeon]
MPETQLNKQILGDYLEANCDRQLFLNLVKGNPEWIQPYRDLIPPKRKKIPNLIVKLGKIYEKTVYNKIAHNNPSKFIWNEEWEEHDAEIKLTENFLTNLYDVMNSTPDLDTFCLFIR